MASQEFSLILKKLRNLGRHERKARIEQLFDSEPRRHEVMAKTAAGITFDFSKQLISSNALKTLLDLAKESGLRDRVQLMFKGGVVNETEGRPALHTSLRRSLSQKTAPYQKLILQTLEQIENLSSKIRANQFFAVDRIPISDVVHIGIGGSYLGPRLASDALRYSNEDRFPVHFLTNVDPGEFERVVNSLKPESTLFVIGSKSFGTKETLQNALSAKEWLESSLKSHKQINKHFVAVTNNRKKALEFGIEKENILPIETWVGGRYSMWSAIGLPIAIHLGMNIFSEILMGASEMDEHFLDTDFEDCLPVLLALISFWNTNILGAETSAVVPYDDRLRFLPEHLQQLEMESNGKTVDRDEKKLLLDSAPITWGGVGTCGQHAFFQLLHQGGRLIPVDFFISLSHPSQLTEHHDMLVANCLAQSEGLMRGSNSFNTDDSKPYLLCSGNQPNSIISFDALTPSIFGALISLYEHKTFALSVLLNINPFDQWGVELAKNMADDIAFEIKRGAPGDNHDASTTKILNRFFRIRAMKVQ